MSQPRASDVVDLKLQVGRRAKGPLLAVLVMLREIPRMLIDGYPSGAVAPAWIVVTHSVDGKTLMKVAAGRGPGAGERLLETMISDADALTIDEFIARWSHVEGRGS